MATEQPNADILLNYPPMILGATQPVFPDPAVPPGEPVVGLPLSLFRMAFNQQQGVLANAVEVAIDPPPHDGPNDDDISIEFIVNSKPMETRQIRPEDRDKRTKFDLFESELRDGSNNRVEYKVHHYSGNVGDSIPLWVLYRANLPGGNNVPGDDDHPYLDIRLPAELGNPAMIGKDEMDAGVPMTVTYRFMYDYDVIHYALRRERFTYTVQPGHTGNSVVITLTRAMFELAGNSANFEISYTVISNLNNATDKRRWSKTLTAEVDKDQNFLNKPILREVQSETFDNPAIIERGKLAGNPLLVVVIPTVQKFEVGDTVEGSYKATPSGTNQPFTGTIEEDGFGGFKPCIMYIPNDKVVTNDDVVATYTLFRGGNVAGRSQKAEAHVIGEGAITLDPPTLAPPATNPINVLDYDAGVTVRVTFAGDPGDQARLKELNPAPGAVPFPVQDIVGGRSDFNLSQTYLAVRHNSDIDLTWELIRGGLPAGESASLRLSVNRMIDNDPRLPTPTITPADNGTTLDLNSFAGDTEAWVKAWRGIALWQPFWLRCYGRASSGTTVLPIYQGVPIGSVGDQSGVVTRAFLDQLADGSQISVLAAVNFDGVANEATAVKFPQRTYTVRAVALENPTITSVRDSKGELANPGTTVDTSVTLSGRASKNLTVQLYNGATPIGSVIAVSANGDWNTTLNGLSANTTYNIKVRALYDTQPESAVWTFNVAALVTPSILSVRDSRGELANPGTTVDTSVTLSGKASGGMTVQLYNGTTAIGSVITVAANGDWTTTLPGLIANTTYTIKAQALYGRRPESAARAFTVTAVITPTLTSVKGSPSGVEIPDNGTTVETSVTLTGTASKGQQVEIFDGSGSSAVSKGTVTANATTGIWELRDIPVAQGAHRFYAQSKYHSGTVYSNVSHLTVTASISPIISSVKGSPSNVEIPPGGTTVETSVILTGKATARLTVQLYNGTTAIGPVIPVDANEDWSTTLTGLSLNTTYNIKVRALYGAGQESGVRTFSIVTLVEPRILSVRNRRNYEIPDGGTTTAPSLTIRGKAEPEQYIDILRDGQPMSTVKADISGDWELPSMLVNFGTYNLTARGNYGDRPVSLPQRFSVLKGTDFDDIDAQNFQPGGGGINLPSMIMQNYVDGSSIRKSTRPTTGDFKEHILRIGTTNGTSKSFEIGFYTPCLKVSFIYAADAANQCKVQIHTTKNNLAPISVNATSPTRLEFSDNDYITRISFYTGFSAIEVDNIIEE